MKIGELSERTGLPASRIRYYETHGLLPVADRAPNGYRDYDAATVERLKAIDLAKSLGFSLEEIAALIPAELPLNPSCDSISAALEQKLAAIETHLKKLRDTRARVKAALQRMKERSPEAGHASVAELSL